MGKTLDELNLSDEPLRRQQPTDARATAWYQFAREIDDLIATGHYTWALSTLEDIQGTVERTQQVSEGQRRAVRNIESARSREGERSRGGSRRYEGWRR